MAQSLIILAWVGWLGGGGLTVIIMQVSVQIGFNCNRPTGTELGNTRFLTEMGKENVNSFYCNHVKPRC